MSADPEDAKWCARCELVTWHTIHPGPRYHCTTPDCDAERGPGTGMYGMGVIADHDRYPHLYRHTVKPTDDPIETAAAIRVVRNIDPTALILLTTDGAT